ncbi:MAG: SUMF1/EgtB/PvdO family nonheme iron enzyme [Anaerolineales bacterium]|nr:SUMF1/EgtB/PvdO family nonheme iron enzyme [Anaerolineales bacterium]
MPIPLNPYIAGNPVGNSPAFVGREDVLREVLRVLRGPNQNAITLYGQRRIGKTSVLQYLQARLPGEGNYQPVYFDLMDKAALPLDHVLTDLARTISERLGLERPDLGDQPESAFRQIWLLRALDSLPAESSLVLLFDEFDVLADPEAQQAAGSFFPYLRDLLALDPTRLQFVFVLGRNVTDLSSIALSVFKGTPSKRVSLLNQKDTNKLVRLSEENNSLAWSEAAVEAVWGLTHGHPYLIQALCTQVWEQAFENHDEPPAVTPEDVRASIPAAIKASRNTLEWLWDGLGPAERVVVSALAQAGARPVDEIELERILRESGVRILIRELQNAPQILQDWDLIEPADGGYCFRVELLRQWIAEYRPLSRVQEDLDRIQPLAESLYQSAEGFYRAKDIQQTEALLMQATNVNPNHVRANDLLAEVLIARGALLEARELLEKLYEFAPQVARPRLVQVYLLLAEGVGDDQARQELFEKILGIDSQQPEARAGLEAIKKFEQEEKELAFRFVEGRQALQRGNWARALDHFRWVVATRPDYAYDKISAADLLADAVRENKAHPPRWKVVLRQPQVIAFILGGAFLVLLSMVFGAGGKIATYGMNTGQGPFGFLATATASLTPTITPTSTSTPTPTMTAMPTNTPLLPTSTHTPPPNPGDPWTRSKDSMVMAYIPAGEFQMGSEAGSSDEKPVHTVYTDAFWMDQSEVTNAMYTLCVEEGDCQQPGGNFYGNAQYADHPVVNVSWDDAVTYCKWAGARLPTEAEWEKAARGGLEGATYPWGNEPHVCTLGAENGSQSSACDLDMIQAKSFASNGYGLYDMAGNVWEWVADWYDSSYYGTLTDGVRNPAGPDSGQARVLRGGSWLVSGYYLRVAARYGVGPSNSYNLIGFRCARETSP